MILIVGGAYQGKLKFAMGISGYKEEDFVDGALCEPEELFTARGIRHFHEYIRRCLEAGREVGDLADQLYEKNPELVVVTNELGYGIVPVQASDRLWRETTGRVCTGLAKHSARVYRVVCGLGMKLK